MDLSRFLKYIYRPLNAYWSFLYKVLWLGIRYLRPKTKDIVGVSGNSGTQNTCVDTHCIPKFVVILLSSFKARSEMVNEH